MTVCQVMVRQFLGVYGYDQSGYSLSDLRSGIDYARGLIEQGYSECPINHYAPNDFIKWARMEINKRKKGDETHEMQTMW